MRKRLMNDYDLSMYNTAEIITINHFRQSKWTHSEVAQAYLEKFLKLMPTNLEVSTRGGVRVELTPAERKAGLYIYNRFLLYKAQQKVRKQELWIELSESSDNPSELTNPIFAVNAEHELNQKRNYMEMFMVVFVYTLLFRGEGSCQRNWVTSEMIAKTLEELEYDDAVVLESLTKNSGRLYAIAFDSQAVPIIRICNDRQTS